MKALQTFLINKGYYSGTAATGYFGPMTQSALKKFQEDNNIVPAGGYFGQMTRARVNNELFADAPTSAPNLEPLADDGQNESSDQLVFDLASGLVQNATDKASTDAQQNQQNETQTTEGPAHTAWRTHAASWYDVDDDGRNTYGYTTATEPPFDQFAAKHTAAAEGSNNIVQKKINDTTVWSQVLGSRSRAFTRKGNPGFVSIGRGLIIGVVQNLTKTDTLGTSLSFNHTSIKNNNSTSKTSIATYLATLTYVKNMPFISFDISAFYGVNRNDILNLNGTGYGYLSKIQGMAAGISKPFQVNKQYTLTPALSFNGSFTKQNNYRDSAASYYKERTTGSATSSFTLGTSYKFETENKDEHTLSFTPSISLNHTPKPKGFTVNTTTSVIQITPERQHPLTYALGAGYQFKRDDVSLDVNYNMQLRSKFIGQNIIVKANYAF
ncbi:MAG TPA: hypothetical protein DIC42_02845 [Holosporales bacterium]|nr:hypothetical protein [Holosporales bacterium]